MSVDEKRVPAPQSGLQSSRSWTDLRHRLHLQAVPQGLLQRRLRWFGHAARRPAGAIIREVINPDPPAHWRKKCGGQLKTWMTTLKEDLARLSGPDVFGLRRWNRD